ncbi:MAG: MBL fold metallo-hydrolase [Defluviitaleaceae bacterium]|nr:MBL fold metallo-hydrolase [Defluviitaleaceae bacterium]
MKEIKITERNFMFSLHRPFEQLDCDLNIGLILGERHNFVIDTGFGSGSVAPVISKVKENRKPVVVINTHSHWDHIWGNCAFENSIIIAHPLLRKYTDWDSDIAKHSSYISGEAVKCLPNMTFEDVLHFPEDHVTIFHSPGHTADCISVYDECDKILYAGDNIGDTPSHPVPYIGTDIPTFERMIEIYKKYPFETCISGHNIPQGRDILERMSNALEDSWKKQIAQYGMPV